MSNYDLFRTSFPKLSPALRRRQLGVRRQTSSQFNHFQRLPPNHDSVEEVPLKASQKRTSFFTRWVAAYQQRASFLSVSHSILVWSQFLVVKCKQIQVLHTNQSIYFDLRLPIPPSVHYSSEASQAGRRWHPPPIRYNAVGVTEF